MRRKVALTHESSVSFDALDGFIAQFHTADTIAVSKAAITGVDDSGGDVLLPGTDVYVNRGYISLKADSVKNAINTTGYLMENFHGDNIPVLMIGWERMSILVNRERNNALLCFQEALVILGLTINSLTVN